MPPVVNVTPTVDLPEPTKQVLPFPDPVQQLPITWKVYTHEDPPTDPVWALITLTPKEYENLSRNTAELLRWIEEARGQLEHYRDE